jgi:hypothetical protein
MSSSSESPSLCPTIRRREQQPGAESGPPLNDRANGCAGRVPDAINSPRENEKEKAARKGKDGSRLRDDCDYSMTG